MSPADLNLDEDCRCDEQRTLVLSLQSPAHSPTGLDLWRYRDDAHACGVEANATADPRCIEHEFVPYADGQWLTFDSFEHHATGYGYQALWGFERRIIIVALVVECGHGTNRVQVIMPTTPSASSPMFDEPVL